MISACPPKLVRERGVILIVTLISLVILMITAVALVRSVDSSLVLAGNMSFNLNLVNQAERSLGKVNAMLVSGALATPAIRQADSLTNNYSSKTVATDKHGIPTALLSTDADWTSAGYSGADISDTTQGVTIRYLIDRLCTTTGVPTKDKCASITLDASGGSNFLSPGAGGGVKPIYRVSVRVTGSRNTQSYVQSTVYVLSDG